jgi:prepilin-type N-terminal cleavage/methylation domain-containing protein
MKYKFQNNNAFTIIELLVAVGILVVVLSFAGVIFRVSIESHRTAMANAEIMQKLRAITGQLNADFRCLRKDGEICIVWKARPIGVAGPVDPNSYERFDRIMFFADGDFQSYNTYGSDQKTIRGNIARICYMLARRRGIEAPAQDKTKRVLARSQHILLNDTDPVLKEFILDPDTFGGTVQEWYDWNNILEYDKITLSGWKNIRWDRDPNDPRGLKQPCKMNMLSVITNIRIDADVDDNLIMGAMVEPTEPNSIHNLLCEGVGEFKVQGWYDARQRWIPEVDPDGDGILSDTDFILDPADSSRLDSEAVPGVLYPYREEPSICGKVILGGEFYCDLNTEEGLTKFQELQNLLNEDDFNLIPGFGRALKFTFTLYDSKGVIENGRTFTHIVYLDD